MSKNSGIPQNGSSTTAKVVSRVQSAVAKIHGGTVPKGSYVGRMQATVSGKSGKSGKK